MSVKFVVIILCLFCCFVFGNNTTVLPDLREFKSRGVLARFLISRNLLEGQLRVRKEQDAFCRNGNYVKIELHDLSPNMSAYGSDQGQLFLALLTIDDITLQKELSDEAKDKVAVTYNVLSIAMPFTYGKTHGVMFETVLTDCPKHVLMPYMTNYHSIKRVDKIVMKTNGDVEICKDGDVMMLNIQHSSECNQDQNRQIVEDFKDVVGMKRGTSTNYPLPFDWGCNMIGQNVSFCGILEERRCGLHQFDPDVCTIVSRGTAKRCPSTAEIVKVTGYFQNEIMPFVPSVPLTSFETMWVDMEHAAGIVFPCLTG